MTQELLKKAEVYCDENKFRLTEPRLAVLKIISSNDKPLGAYDILEELGQVIKNPKPPTAYRAIEFWQKHGFIHRIESLNAFVTCHVDHMHQGSQFMVCNDCGQVQEIHLCSLPHELNTQVTQKSFKMTHWNAEINGLCTKCQ